jgi:hypothetical protein
MLFNVTGMTFNIDFVLLNIVWNVVNVYLLYVEIAIFSNFGFCECWKVYCFAHSIKKIIVRKKFGKRNVVFLLWLSLNFKLDIALS